MLTTQELKNLKVLVLGFAMTGESVARFLLKAGAQVTINDRDTLTDQDKVQELQNQGAIIIDGGHPDNILDQPFDMIIKNPGIPYHLPLLQKAMALEIPIVTDVELASQFTEANLIAITGSNGKTTTTSLLHAILKEAGQGRAWLAGNIGVPTLDVIQQAQAGDQLVMEVSSFQLVGTINFHPQIAIITNILEAHLDYHGNREEYIAAKLKVFQKQTASDFLIYRHDQGELDQLVSSAKSQLIPFSAELQDEFLIEQGVYLQNQWIYYAGEAVIPLEAIQIPGQHNIENAMAAIAAAKLIGISDQQIEKSVRGYHGMKHRIQFVAEAYGRKIYNDSKATNVAATQTALKSFTQPIRYIGGGLDRGNTFEELLPYLKQVQAAYLYGETQGKLAETMREAGITEVHCFDNLPSASQAAYEASQRDEVILLSPSCASWDQFKTYEERGDLFITTIKQLIQTRPLN